MFIDLIDFNESDFNLSWVGDALHE
jgi:hypothetical protein